MKLRAAGLSDAGQVRASNQDAYAVLLPPDLPGLLDGLLVVADGMGGHRGGATASQLAVAAIIAHFNSETASTLVDGANIGLAAQQAVEAANQQIYSKANEDRELSGMGTTCTLIVASAGMLHLAHVGDSSAHLFRDGATRKLTNDHSWVANEVRLGHLSEAEAAHHPRKNVLLRAVGVHPTVEVEGGTVESREGDIVLLCSDGLTNMIEPPELLAVVRSGEPGEICARLVATANERGAPDNVTAVIARIAESPT